MSEKQNNICEGQLANMREANAFCFVLFTTLYEIVIPKGEKISFTCYVKYPQPVYCVSPYLSIYLCIENTNLENMLAHLQFVKKKKNLYRIAVRCSIPRWDTKKFES